MHWLTTVFNRAFVHRFYQAHLLLFLFLLLACTGMADGKTILLLHYGILATAFSSAFTLACIWLVWLLYSLNGLRYMLNTLGKPEFGFLFTANSAQPFNLLKALGWCVIQINAPILIYGGIGVVIGVKQAHYLPGLLGAAALLFNIIITMAIVYFRLVNIHLSPVVDLQKLLPSAQLKPGMLSFMLRNITYDNKVALIGTKLFSCAILYGAHYEWASFNYDIRWMQVAMAISIPAQGVLLYQVWSFETSYLSFTRNFPTPVYKRYLNILWLVLILLIPEILLLSAYCVRFNILWQLPVYAIYALDLPMLLYAMLFTRGFNQESFNSFLFAIGLATFFVTLFGFTWLLAIAFLPISFMVYKEAFYEFEEDSK